MEDVELRELAASVAERYPVVQDAEVEKPEPWSFKRFWTTHIRITIEEEASRDHLALERTFLAYMRTASAYAQFGVALAQLFRLNVTDANTITPTTLKVGKAMGAIVEAIAVIFTLIGAAYFAKQQIGLMKGAVVSRGYEVSVMVGVSFALLVILFGLIVGADNW